MSEAVKIKQAAAWLQDRCGDAPKVGMVLGSGLRRFAESVGQVHGPAETIAFSEVPHWPTPNVEGHGQQLVVAPQVACLSGRVHLYEGWIPGEVVRAVRTLRAWGCEEFVLTNAAGGIHREFVPGDLMVLTDHLNLTGSNPMAGPAADPDLGPRFPDQSALYDRELRERLHRAAQASGAQVGSAAQRGGHGGALREGVYAGLLGPTYETPAEVRMLRTLGADAVGMSTVHEAMALGAMGARVAAVSLISNAAAGVTGAPLSHDEVVEQGVRTEARFTSLLTEFLQP